MNQQKLIDEYSESYCAMLEMAYGQGIMSAGGTEAIETLFEGLNIKNKKALDIGFGLGGIMMYLAKAHGMQITGLEVSPWLAEEANRRTPLEHRHLLNYLVYDPL